MCLNVITKVKIPSLLRLLGAALVFVGDELVFVLRYNFFNVFGIQKTLVSLSFVMRFISMQSLEC
ncbi:MAG: hypothetical protein ACJA1Z_002101 [Patiriisocius sp.]|jgi:hypothetical protein